jgi:hypothetical protein
MQQAHGHFVCIKPSGVLVKLWSEVKGQGSLCFSNHVAHTFQHGRCEDCTPVKYSVFKGPGSPDWVDNCPWACEPGRYASGRTCLTCSVPLCAPSEFQVEDTEVATPINVEFTVAVP